MDSSRAVVDRLEVCAALLGPFLARSNGLIPVAVHVADVRSKRIPEFLKTLKGKG